MKYISFNVFKYSKVHDSKKFKTKMFLKQTFGVSIKTFCKKWEEETLPK